MSKPTSSQRTTILAVVAIATAFALLVPSVAQAGGRGEHRRGREHRVAPLPPLPVPHLPRLAPIVPPRRLIGRERSEWGRYQRGEEFYLPHHHAHRVYYFPVATPRGAELAPHFYCGDRLFFVGHVAAPHVSLRIGF